MFSKNGKNLCKQFSLIIYCPDSCCVAKKVIHKGPNLCHGHRKPASNNFERRLTPGEQADVHKLKLGEQMVNGK